MRNSVFLISIMIAVFLFNGCSEEGTTKLNTDANVVLSPNLLDLGVVNKHDELSVEFEIINKTNQQRKIVSSAKSCGCTKIKIVSKALKSHGGRTNVILKFDPENEEGTFEKSVFFRLDNDDILVFKFKGKV